MDEGDEIKQLKARVDQLEIMLAKEVVSRINANHLVARKFMCDCDACKFLDKGESLHSYTSKIAWD